jgi:hypothetical protein
MTAVTYAAQIKVNEKGDRAEHGARYTLLRLSTSASLSSRHSPG